MPQTIAELGAALASGELEAVRVRTGMRFAPAAVSLPLTDRAIALWGRENPATPIATIDKDIWEMAFAPSLTQAARAFRRLQRITAAMDAEYRRRTVAPREG